MSVPRLLCGADPNYWQSAADWQSTLASTFPATPCAPPAHSGPFPPLSIGSRFAVIDASIRFVVELGSVDAIAIGYKSAAEVDEVIGRVDRALKA